jgi:hypothetical protein
MKILESVNFVPPQQRKSKFQQVFQTLVRVSTGQYLPVLCETEQEAGHLKQECKRRNLTAERRGRTVFIQGCSVAAVPVYQSGNGEVEVILESKR